MKGTKLLGAVLLVLGVLALAYGGFSYTKNTEKASIGPIKIEVQDKERVNIPLWAGLAGAIEVAGLKGYVTTDLSPGYGYSGIVVAMLAAQHPIGVVAAALFVAVVFVGADGMSRALGVPSFIADVIVAISLLTMLVALMFTTYRLRR